MKKKKSVKSKRGFTLVELVVTVAVLSIVAGMGIGIVASAIKNYSTASTTSKEQDEALLIERFIVDAIRGSSLIHEADTDASTGGVKFSTSQSSRYLYFENGRLVTNETMVSKTGGSPEVYKQYYDRVKTISLTVKKSKPAADKEIDSRCFIHVSYTIEMDEGYEISGSTVMINADEKYPMNKSNSLQYTNVNNTFWITSDDSVTYVRDPSTDKKCKALQLDF